MAPGQVADTGLQATYAVRENTFRGPSTAQATGDTGSLCTCLQVGARRASLGCFSYSAAVISNINLIRVLRLVDF